MGEIRLQILEANYWEHYKFLKDLHYIYPSNHKKIIELQDKVNEMLVDLNKLKTNK